MLKAATVALGVAAAYTAIHVGAVDVSRVQEAVDGLFGDAPSNRADGSPGRAQSDGPTAAAALDAAARQSSGVQWGMDTRAEDRKRVSR